MSLASKLTEERRSRLAAERRLELKQAELFAANNKLGKHAQKLSEEIVETRAEVETIRGENQRVKSDLNVANKKIEIAERRLWHSIRTINDGFAFYNPDNEMVMANEAYLSVFDGLEAIKPGVNYVTLLQYLTEEGIVNTGDMSAKEWRQMMTERFQSPEPETKVIELWNGRSVQLIDQRGPEGDVVSLGLDITATVAYERKLEQARIVAESANRAKSAFLANMSHEIRTPMNGVIGMADLLLESMLPEEERTYAETIKSSAEALLVIINDVLDYSKIEAEKLALKPTAFDLRRAVEEVVRLLQPGAQDKGLALLLDFDLQIPDLLVGDPGRLRQVMTNLIGNAVKFTPEGHVVVNISLAKDLGDDRLSIAFSIQDTGIGIPADLVQHIFGEFNQVEDERNRQFEGTGLGLAISQRLVKLMDSQINVQSEEGVGSCFSFEIELAVPPEAKVSALSVPSGFSRVGLWDTSIVTGGILTRRLKQMGADVVEPALGAPLAELLTSDIDLLLLVSKDPAEDVATAKAAAANLPIVLICSDAATLGTDTVERVAAVLDNPPKPEALIQALEGLPVKEPEQPCEKPAPFAFRSRLRGAPPAQKPSFDVQAPPAAKAPPRQMRILAAEDNKTNQLVLGKMIRSLNVTLKFANNGEEAVEEFQAFKPDMMFMDISMPKVDGKEATRRIRALETDGHTPIVALTAHAMSGDQDPILAAGLDAYLTKPIRKDKIHAAIRQHHTGEMAPLEPDQADG